MKQKRTEFMRRISLNIAGLLTCLIASQTTAPAQTEESRNTSRSGIHLYGASAYGSYYSIQSPAGSATALPLETSPSFGSSYGGGITVGFEKYSRRNRLALIYSPSYMGLARYPEITMTSHAVAFSAEHTFTAKWFLTTGATAGIYNSQQFSFNPTPASRLTNAPVTFDDFAAALLSGQYSDELLAALLTSSPLATLPADLLLYGRRTLNTSAQVGLSYRPSTRLQFHVSASGSRMQNLADSGIVRQGNPLYLTPDPVTGNVDFTQYVLPRATIASIGGGVNYALTPRTSSAFVLSTSRNISGFQDAYLSTFSASLSRRMGQRWVATGNAGLGLTRSIRSTFSVPSRPGVTWGAGLAYGAGSHSGSLAYSHGFGDSYGLGARTTNTATASWTWHPARIWTVGTSFTHQQFKQGFGQEFVTWSAGASASVALSKSVSISTQYSHLNYSGSLASALSQFTQEFTQQGVQVSLSWRSHLGRSFSK